VAHVPVQQVSVFLDNRPGSLSDVMGYLDKGQIKIFALSIADAGEYGLIRMVTDNPEKATKILEDADFNLAKSKKNIEVTAILITAKDKISKITKILGESGLNIEYAYSSAVHTDGRFALILRVNDANKAEGTLRENDIATLSLAEMKEHFQ
jgi:hypothetical protein